MALLAVMIKQMATLPPIEEEVSVMMEDTAFLT
jgi:hypothetical protein